MLSNFKRLQDGSSKPQCTAHVQSELGSLLRAGFCLFIFSGRFFCVYVFWLLKSNAVPSKSYASNSPIRKDTVTHISLILINKRLIQCIFSQPNLCVPNSTKGFPYKFNTYEVKTYSQTSQLNMPYISRLCWLLKWILKDAMSETSIYQSMNIDAQISH